MTAWGYWLKRYFSMASPRSRLWDRIALVARGNGIYVNEPHAAASNLLSRLRGGGNPAGRFHVYASRPCPCHAPREIIPPRGLRWRPHPSGTPPPWTIRPRRRTGGAVWIFPRTGFVFRRANGKFQPRLRPPAHVNFNAAESSQPPRPRGRAFASSLLEGFRRQFRGVEYVENLVRPRDFKDKPRL